MVRGHDGADIAKHTLHNLGLEVAVKGRLLQSGDTARADELTPLFQQGLVTGRKTVRVSNMAIERFGIEEMHALPITTALAVVCCGPG